MHACIIHVCIMYGHSLSGMPFPYAQPSHKRVVVGPVCLSVCHVRASYPHAAIVAPFEQFPAYLISVIFCFAQQTISDWV